MEIERDQITVWIQHWRVTDGRFKWPFFIAKNKKLFRNEKENKAQTIDYAMFDGYPIVACICLFN